MISKGEARGIAFGWIDSGRGMPITEFATTGKTSDKDLLLYAVDREIRDAEQQPGFTPEDLRELRQLREFVLEEL